MNEKKLTRDSLDYPSNSETKPKAGRESEEPKKDKPKPVLKGGVKKEKKTMGKKFSETFFETSDAGGSVWNYILQDLVVPGIKNTMCNAVEGIFGRGMIGEGFERLMFGESGRKRTRDSRKPYVSYSSYYDERNDRKPNYSRSSRARHSFDDVIFETRVDAEEVLSHLVDLTIDYGVASVADLYEAAGMTGDHTDNKYGWTTLKGASTDRVRNGYIINLPQAKPID